jgi:2-desacetyl-2-hydroxyethyl bacteriochlorophyllide A dehydrogenase
MSREVKEGESKMANKMLAAVFEGPGKLILKEVPEPQIQHTDQIKIQVEGVGICGTDVHIVAVPPGYNATPGTILGHEYVGRVVDVGETVTNVKIGDRVVVNPNDYCGTCTYCQMHKPNLCVNVGAIGIHVDGAYARYNVVPSKLAFKLNDQVPMEHGAFAEMLADVINGTNKVRLQPGETAVILGAGPIGHLYAQMFKAAGAAKIILVDAAPYRLEYCHKMGFDLVVNYKDQDLKEFVLSQTEIGADVVVDASGSALPTALDIVRKGGSVVIFGVNTQAQAQFPQSQITMKELTIYGSWLANATFPAAVKVLESRVLDLDGLISHRLPLSQIHEGLSLLANREALKIVIYPF